VALPPYRLVRQWHSDVKPMPILFVRVRSERISANSMIALACRLGKERSSERALDLYIFDDDRAAKVYSPAHEGNAPQTEKALRAVYEFSREKGEAWIDLRSVSSSKWVHIDFGQASRGSLRSVFWGFPVRERRAVQRFRCSPSKFQDGKFQARNSSPLRIIPRQCPSVRSACYPH
jgi:hypothetical protein